MAKELTSRQLEVLTLISEGFELNEVAQQLFLEKSTVKTHLRNAIEGLDAKNRSHAVMLGIRSGLLVERG